MRTVVLGGMEMTEETVACPLCGRETRLVMPRLRPFYGCIARCGGFILASNTGEPAPVSGLLGAHRRAHASFDRLWMRHGMTRDAAYRWLGCTLGLATEDAHISRLTIQQCETLVNRVDRILGPTPEVPRGTEPVRGDQHAG